MDMPNLGKSEFVQITGANRFSWYVGSVKKIFIVHTWISPTGNILVYVLNEGELIIREVKQQHGRRVDKSLIELLRRKS